MTSGRRVSLALFSPKTWRNIPQHALNELEDLNFCVLDLLARLCLHEQDQYDRKVLNEIHAKGQTMPAEEIVDRKEDDKGEEEPENLVPSAPERDVILQEWCLLPKVSLLFILMHLMVA